MKKQFTQFKIAILAGVLISFGPQNPMADSKISHSKFLLGLGRDLCSTSLPSKKLECERFAKQEARNDSFRLGQIQYVYAICAGYSQQALPATSVGSEVDRLKKQNTSRGLKCMEMVLKRATNSKFTSKAKKCPSIVGADEEKFKCFIEALSDILHDRREAKMVKGKGVT